MERSIMAGQLGRPADLRETRGQVLVNGRDPYLGVDDEENERDGKRDHRGQHQGIPGPTFRRPAPPTSVISPISRGSPIFKMIPWARGSAVVSPLVMRTPISVGSVTGCSASMRPTDNWSRIRSTVFCHCSEKPDPRVEFLPDPVQGPARVGGRHPGMNQMIDSGAEHADQFGGRDECGQRPGPQGQARWRAASHARRGRRRNPRAPADPARRRAVVRCAGRRRQA